MYFTSHQKKNLQKIIDIDLAGCSNKSGYLTVDNKKSVR